MIVSSKNGQKQTLYPHTVGVTPTINELQRLFDDLEAIAKLPDSALDINVDFHYCEFLNHTAVALLGGLARLVKARDGRIFFDWDTLPQRNGIESARNICNEKSRLLGSIHS